MDYTTSFSTFFPLFLMVLIIIISSKNPKKKKKKLFTRFTHLMKLDSIFMDTYNLYTCI